MQNEAQKRVLYYGGRKTNKLVRCYRKKALGVFRVEVEMHSGLLQDISTLDDFLFLPDLVSPKHCRFVGVDWNRLEKHLKGRPSGDGSRIIAGARRRADSLERVRRYLKRKGLVNVHRFLAPLAINNEIKAALERWARHFKKDSLWASTK